MAMKSSMLYFDKILTMLLVKRATGFGVRYRFKVILHSLAINLQVFVLALVCLIVAY